MYARYTSDRYPQFLESSIENYQESLKPILKRLSKWLPQNKNINYLDVACGAGQLLYGMKSIGYNNISGIDISPQQVAVAKKYVLMFTKVMHLFFYLRSKLF